MQQTLCGFADFGKDLVAGLGDPLAVLLIGIERLVTHAFGAIRVDVVDGHAIIQRRVAFRFRGQKARFGIKEGR